MLRRLVSTFTSAAMIGALATAAVTSPASAAEPAENPALEGCGIPVTLVLDASGSIDGNEPAQMRAAATAFLNGLDSTGSTARIIEFAQRSAQTISRQDIEGQGLADLLAAVAAYKHPGLGTTTNWESPLWRAYDEPIPDNKGLVVFMTDGDPNTIGDVNGSGTTGTDNTTAANAAQVYADQLKTAGNRMLAVGIGTTNDGQKGRLEQISGPNLVTSIPDTATINDFDAVVTNDFDELTAAMKRVAASLCGGSVTVRKLTDTETPHDFQPAGGWKFSATVSPGSVPDDFEWVQPAGEPTNTATLTTQASDGIAQFQYAPKNTDTRTVRIQEDVQDTYVPSYYECTFKGLDPPDNQYGGLTQDGDKAYFDLALKSDESASCDVYNTRTLAELKLVKKVEGADPDKWTLTAKTGSPNDDRNVSTPGGSGDFETVYAGTEYTLGESGPAGYSQDGDWVCINQPRKEVEVAETDEPVNVGNKLTLGQYDRVTCTISNKRDLGSLTIKKEFNAQTSGFTGTFDINYACVDGADPVKSGTVKLANGQSETLTGLPTGTACTVTEPSLPTAPDGWKFNAASFSPADGKVTIEKDAAATVTVVNSITKVNPVVVKRVCPINPTLVKPKPTKAGKHVLIKKIKTNSNCVIVKPAVLCRPVASAAAGETAFCDTKTTKRGNVRVNTKGYDAVKVKVVVRAKPKPGHEDKWKPKTWRKSWILS